MSKNITSKYLLSVRNSKAIKAADIAIDAITVLSGVNASGKSTLARMTHEIVNMSAIYPLLLERYAWKSINGWTAAIVELDARLSDKWAGVLSVAGAKTSAMQFESKLGQGRFHEVVNSLDAYTQATFGKYREQMGKGDAKRAFAAFVRAAGIGDELTGDVQRVYAVFTEKCAKAFKEYEAGERTRGIAVWIS